MRRAIPVLLLILFPVIPALGQSGNQTCSSPGTIFGGETGTPVSISDSIQINDSLIIEDLHVRVDISHGFVADLLVDLGVKYEYETTRVRYIIQHVYT